MSKYRTTFVKGRNGQTVYAVEEQNPETKEWAVLKVFNNRESAEDEKQTLEMYGKRVKSENKGLKARANEWTEIYLRTLRVQLRFNHTQCG